MIVIICGSRDHPFFTAEETAYLDALRARITFTEVVEGGAPGVDRLAGAWADSRGITHTTMHANWTGEGPAAGPRRNLRMAKYVVGRPCWVIAFPGGRGTANMIKTAREYGIPVIEYPAMEERY